MNLKIVNVEENEKGEIKNSIVKEILKYKEKSTIGAFNFIDRDSKYYIDISVAKILKPIFMSLLAKICTYSVFKESLPESINSSLEKIA